MEAVTHLEKVIAGEVSAVTHLEKVIAQETTAVTYTEKVIAGTAPPVTHLQKVIAGVAKPVTHLEYVWAGGSPPSVQEYTGAVPVTFVADGTPLLDYIISGNMSQTGTPSPDNPIMPEGTGEKTGNLFDESNFALVQVTSTAYRYGTSLGVLPQGTYTFSATKSASAQSIYLTARLNGTYSQTTISTVPFTFTADGNSEYIIRTANNTGTTWEAEHYSDIMLNTGSTPLPYEPYGYKIPILSANTTTPVYLGEVQTTRRIAKIDLGTLNWRKTASGNFWSDNFISDMKAIYNTDTGNAICTTFKEVTPNAVASTPYAFSSCLNNQQRPFVNKTGFENLTAEEFKQAMSGVYMYYVLANEETAVVNEPLMKIGDYADTLSMEQAGAQIPTANGSTTLDVETTVPPSEVYIKYRGEAVATLSMLSAEVSSPEETPEEADPEETEETENGGENLSLQHEPETVE